MRTRDLRLQRLLDKLIEIGHKRSKPPFASRRKGGKKPTHQSAPGWGLPTALEHDLFEILGFSFPEPGLPTDRSQPNDHWIEVALDLMRASHQCLALYVANGLSCTGAFEPQVNRETDLPIDEHAIAVIDLLLTISGDFPRLLDRLEAAADQKARSDALDAIDLRKGNEKPFRDPVPLADLEQLYPVLEMWIENRWSIRELSQMQDPES